jgi:hypothetical protein
MFPSPLPQEKKIVEIGLVTLRYEKYYDRHVLLIRRSFYQLMEKTRNNTEALRAKFRTLNTCVKD